jgi:hypothetical protein
MNTKKILFAIFSSLIILSAASPASAACTLSNLSGCDKPGLIALIVQFLQQKGSAVANITVKLADTNPEPGIVLTGQVGADLAEYTFSNSGTADATVKQLTFNTVSPYSGSILTNLYLSKDSKEIKGTLSTTIGSFSLRNNDGLFTVPAGSSVTVSVMADVSKSSNNSQTVAISLASVSSDGTLSTNLPLNGNTFNLTNVSLASAAIPGANKGDQSLVLPAKDAKIDPGEGVTVWETSLLVSNGTAELSKLSLKQEGTIGAGDIGNFQLFIDGEKVSSADSFDANGYVSFGLDEFLSSGLRDIKVTADVTGGSSKTIKLALLEKGDISVKDSQYGVNILSMQSDLEAATLTLNAGKMSYVADDAKLSSIVVNNSTAVLIGRFNFTAAGEPIKLNSLKIGFDYSKHPASADHIANGEATLKNGTLFINGIKQSAADLKSTGTDYPASYTFQPGIATPIEIYADIDDVDGAGEIIDGDTIAAELLKNTGNATGTISKSKANVPDSDPASKETRAAAITIGNGAVTLAETENYADQTVSFPQAAYKIASFVLTAGKAEDFNLTNFKVTIEGLAGKSNKAVPTFNSSDLQNMYIAYSIDGAASALTATRNYPSMTNNFSVDKAVVPRGKSAIISVYSGLSASGELLTGDQIRTYLQVSGTGAISNARYDSIGGSGEGLAGQTVTAIASSLAITRDPSTPSAALAYAGQTLNSVAYKFSADNQGYTVTQIAFKIANPSALKQVSLKSGNTVIQTRQPAAEVIFGNFTAPIAIAAQANKIFTVELALNDTVQPGTNLTTVLSLDDTQVRNNSGGASSVGVGLAVSGNPIYAYQAIPQIAIVKATSPKVGANTLANLFIKSSGNSKIAWNKIVFDVSKTGDSIGKLSDAALWDVAANKKIASCTISGAASAGLAGAYGTQSGTITCSPSAEEQVSGLKSYALKATLGTGILAPKDSISVSLDPNEDSFAAPSSSDSPSLSGSSFIWSDLSAKNHSASSADWNGDYLVGLSSDLAAITAGK